MPRLRVARRGARREHACGHSRGRPLRRERGAAARATSAGVGGPSSARASRRCSSQGVRGSTTRASSSRPSCIGPVTAPSRRSRRRSRPAFDASWSSVASSWSTTHAPRIPASTPRFAGRLRRALGASLRPIARDHTIFRSFYLVDRPFGRVRGPDTVEGLELGGRLAVVYTRHDLGGALARDNLGNWVHPVTPGGDDQRERAIRFGVNLVMYALCLDYKDDQVHAPFIMRRRGAGPRP
ncbi:MAG: DUF4159 domain-containing protein [Polyangiales bacterium]